MNAEQLESFVRNESLPNTTRLKRHVTAKREQRGRPTGGDGGGGGAKADQECEPARKRQRVEEEKGDDELEAALKAVANDKPNAPDQRLLGGDAGPPRGGMQGGGGPPNRGGN